jgi:hypothetical protein
VAAAVRGAVELTGARAACVGARHPGGPPGGRTTTATGDVVLLLGSDGYGCDTMAAGATLPLDAGLPLTECVRLGRTVVRGGAGGPAWVAAPARAGALDAAVLVSLTHPVPTADVHALEQLAAATAAAWARCPADDADRDSRLTAPDWLDAAAVVRPLDGPGGDVVVLAPGVDHDTAWLVVADVCGSGARAARVAADVEAWVRTLLLAPLTPDQLLDSIEAGLRRHATRGRRFVTAVAARLQRVGGGVVVDAAGAGHLPLLVAGPDGVAEHELGGLPLDLVPPSLLREPVTRRTVRFPLAAASTLVACTDGLVDRSSGDRSADLRAAAAAPAPSAPALLRHLVGALDATGATADDLAVVVVRPRPQ